MLALYRGGRQAEALEVFQEARAGARRRARARAGAGAPAAAGGDPRARPGGRADSRRRRGDAATCRLRRPRSSAARRSSAGSPSCCASRLVTLTGPPGVGKSRLALEAARSLEAETDGTWFVDLARADADADVIRLVADAVDARGADPLERSVARLRDLARSLLLDACERVARGSPGRVAASRSRRPVRGVRVLATSREVLHAAGEVRVVVEPLAVPEADPGSATGRPAVDLFVERARAARPGFELDPETAPLVAEIAAGWTACRSRSSWRPRGSASSGSPEILVARRPAPGGLLRDRPAARRRRAPLADARRVELRPTPRATRRRCSTSSPCTGAARRCVARRRRRTPWAGRDDGTTCSAALVDKSVVTVSFPGGVARYDLLDTVREYVLERLAGSGRARGRAAGARRVLRRAGRGGARELRGRTGWPRRGASQLENDNFWAALDLRARAPDAVAGAGSARRSAGTSRLRSACRRGGSSSSSRWRWRPRRPRTSRSSCSRTCPTWKPRRTTSLRPSRPASAALPWRPAPRRHRPRRRSCVSRWRRRTRGRAITKCGAPRGGGAGDIRGSWRSLGRRGVGAGRGDRRRGRRRRPAHGGVRRDRHATRGCDRVRGVSGAGRPRRRLGRLAARGLGGWLYAIIQLAVGADFRRSLCRSAWRSAAPPEIKEGQNVDFLADIFS